MKAVVIDAETQEARLIDIDPDKSLATLQESVGGWVECVGFPNFDMWLNEEGKLIGLPVNRAATKLWESQYGPTDVMMGNVVITGVPDDEGRMTELDTEAALFVQGIANAIRILLTEEVPI
jgi:hypothetical protein